MVEKHNGFNLRINNGIATITFNFAKVNLFNTVSLKDFHKVFQQLDKNKKVKVVIVTAKGKTFIAGADISEMQSFGKVSAAKFSKLFHDTLIAVENCSKPVIAAVNGYALGGGCELVLACDIVIASKSAVFGQPELKLGIIPGAGGTQRLPAKVGKAKAKELILTGRNVKADEALSIGLVEKVVPAASLQKAALTMANAISSMPSQPVFIAKRLIDHGSLAKERKEFAKLFGKDDQKKLMKKFLRHGK